MEDVGYVSQNPAVLEQFKATSAYTLREKDLLDGLQLVMSQGTAPAPSSTGYTNPAQLAIGLRSTRSLADPNNRAIWKRDIRMSLYRNMETTTVSAGGAANEGLKQVLAEIAVEPCLLNTQPTLDFLTHEIGVRLYGFMLQEEEDVDVTVSLSALGVDSLVAIEIRNWWRQSLGLEISVLELLNAGSIAQLGKLAVQGLQKKTQVEVKEDGDTY